MAGAAACALPAVAAAAPSLSVVARGFDNPRHVALAPDGTLYLAAAGKAGGQCIGPRRDPTCIGFSGKIWALNPGSGAKRVVQAGLLSLGGQDGTFTVGPDGVSVAPDGALYTVIASGTPRQVAGAPRRAQAQAGELWRVRPRPLTDVAAIDSFEWRHNSDGVNGDLNSDPYDVLALADGRQIVADAGANAILEAHGGAVRLLAVIRGPGRAQRVPTSLALGPDGDIYVGELAEGAGSGRARVLKIPPSGGTPTVVASGFSAITGLAFGGDGSMYVTELSTNLRSQSAPGRITRIKPDGSRTSFSRGLLFPQGAAVTADGDVYLSNFSVLPARTPSRSPFRGAGGEVVKVSGL
ncbi:ScyD/ScyE family protein [Conexibacter sp. JD483]|uniref:ScyD/ScyE family protein n=1 Tax=unclassified Conexibacter TaxID=2627773 RepID=UPI002715983E|nr:MULTISPECIES: ScyD/ScyE family protein [unclassified Conexibacter]MDO8185758.1 ScyD/ScyE family protein [Conexibacter sp. CPCC 205706]MDO8199135.1 ScyD/ScyE family protein [Conexibacter sp. CPCC 205762]MDR9369920.1 ScyD/ScyE family protein [Conexibacter sp. JD483]